ncbi:MAG: hypothetical protein AAF334_07635 [Pseudomonadota bacterium]
MERLKSKLKTVLVFFVALGAVLIFLPRADPEDDRSKPAMAISTAVLAARSQALFNVEEQGSNLILTVVIVTDGKTDESLRSRAVLAEGQRYSMIVRADDTDESQPGDRFDFIRTGNTVFARSNGGSSAKSRLIRASYTAR